MTDPITNIFVNRQPSMSEIGDALARSLSSKNYASPSQAAGVSFGEALNNIRGAKIKEAVQLEGIQQGRKKLELQEKQFDLQAEKTKYDKEKILNDTYNKAITHVEKLYGPESAVRIHSLARNDPKPISTVSQEQTVNQLIGLADKHGIKPQPKKTKPELGVYQVYHKPPGGGEPVHIGSFRKDDPRLSQMAGDPNYLMISGVISAPSASSYAKKQQYIASQPISPELSRLTGLSPTTTNEEARKLGVSFDLKEKRINEFTDMKAGGINAIRLGRQLKALLKEYPDIRGAPAITATFVTNLRSQVSGLRRMMDIKEEAPRSPKAYSDIFNKFAIADGRMQSIMLDLAFATAQSRETGKLTENDVERALNTLGSRIKAGEDMSVIMDDYMNRIDTMLQTRIKTGIGMVSGSLQKELDDEIIGKVKESGDISVGDAQSLSPAAQAEAYRILQEMRAGQ